MAGTSEPRHIFLSYSRKDTKFMRRLLNDLEKAGFEVWVDETGLEPGTPDWEDAIEAALTGACCLVVILSPDAKDSRWVGLEIAVADRLGLRTFPILARGNQRNAVPMRLEMHQRVDATRNYSPALHELKEAIAKHLSVRPSEEVTPVLVSVLASFPRWLLGVSGIALVGVVVVGAIAVSSMSGNNTSRSEEIPNEQPLAEPTVTVVPTETIQSTIDPIEEALDGVNSNNQWTPHTQGFDGVEMVLVPTGCFMMGSADGEVDERPVHEQCFDEPFWLDRTEVTNAQYGSSGVFAGGNRPRDSVTWYEAKAHCESRGARLPTEAEWEYAARGPNSLVYPWGNTFIADKAVIFENAGGRTAEVGSRLGGASWVGALDMSGNVWEWVSTIYQPYPYVDTDGREGNVESDSVVGLRGGSWDEDDSVRAAFRGGSNPTYAFNDYGFRCVRDY